MIDPFRDLKYRGVDSISQDNPWSKAARITPGSTSSSTTGNCSSPRSQAQSYSGFFFRAQSWQVVTTRRWKPRQQAPRFRGHAANPRNILLQIPNHPSYPLPRPGEWVLLDIGIQRVLGGYDGEEFPTKIYRGSLAELYTLLCNSEPGRKLRLVCASRCLFCTCLWEARTIHTLTGQTSSSDIISIDRIRVLEGKGEKTEGRDAETDPDQIDEHAVDDSATAPPSPPFKSLLRRTNNCRRTPSPRRGAKPKKRKGAPGTRKNLKRRAAVKQ